MTRKRIVENQKKTISFYFTFRKFRHASSEVSVENRSNNYILNLRCVSNQLAITMTEAEKNCILKDAN